MLLHIVDMLTYVTSIVKSSVHVMEGSIKSGGFSQDDAKIYFTQL